MKFFEKIKNFAKGFADKWKAKAEDKSAEIHEEIYDGEKAKAKKKRYRDTKLSEYLKTLTGKTTLLDIADLLRGGMSRRDIRLMIRRFRRYAAGIMFKNRPGDIVGNKGFDRFYISNKGKFFYIGKVLQTDLIKGRWL